MKKLCNLSVSWSILSTVLVFAFALMPFGAFGASTIGTNMLTTGTFEAQNTASAAFFLTGNTIQVGGYASAAYSRFGTGTTSYSAFLTTTNDALVAGDLEVDGVAFFDTKVGIGGAPSTVFEVQGTASASYFYTTGTLQVGALFTTATVAYSRFGAGTTGYSTFVDAANDLLITGALEVDSKAFFDGTASVAGTFEAMGTASASNAFVSRNLVVGSNVASSSSIYTAEFGGFDPATVSILFGGNSSSNGTCFQMKNTVGAWVYARIVGTTWTVNAIDCNNQ